MFGYLVRVLALALGCGLFGYVIGRLHWRPKERPGRLCSIITGEQYQYIKAMARALRPLASANLLAEDPLAEITLADANGALVALRNAYLYGLVGAREVAGLPYGGPGGWVAEAVETIDLDRPVYAGFSLNDMARAVDCAKIAQAEKQGYDPEEVAAGIRALADQEGPQIDLAALAQKGRAALDWYHRHMRE